MSQHVGVAESHYVGVVAELPRRVDQYYQIDLNI